MCMLQVRVVFFLQICWYHWYWWTYVVNGALNEEWVNLAGIHMARICINGVPIGNWQDKSHPRGGNENIARWIITNQVMGRKVHCFDWVIHRAGGGVRGVVSCCVLHYICCCLYCVLRCWWHSNECTPVFSRHQTPGGVTEAVRRPCGGRAEALRQRCCWCDVTCPHYVSWTLFWVVVAVAQMIRPCQNMTADSTEDDGQTDRVMACVVDMEVAYFPEKSMSKDGRRTSSVIHSSPTDELYR